MHNSIGKPMRSNAKLPLIYGLSNVHLTDDATKIIGIQQWPVGAQYFITEIHCSRTYAKLIF